MSTMTEYTAGELEAEDLYAKEYRQAFKDFFHSGGIDFESMFEPEDFAVWRLGETQNERAQRVGLKLITTFRQHFEDQTGLPWRD